MGVGVAIAISHVSSPLFFVYFDIKIIYVILLLFTHKKCMKHIMCPEEGCDYTVEAESMQDAMMKLMPHYKEAHAEMMAKGTEETKKIWMANFQKQWDETPDA